MQRCAFGRSPPLRASFRASPAALGRFNKEVVAPPKDTDPYDLYSRFVNGHRQWFAKAMAEMANGRRESHWEWVLLPTPPYVDMRDGIPRERGCRYNRHYALRDLPPQSHLGHDAAVAFLKFPTTDDGVSLRGNYLQLLRLINDKSKEPGATAVKLMGLYEARKLVASAEHFLNVSQVAVDRDVAALCGELLERLFLNDQFAHDVGRAAPEDVLPGPDSGPAVTLEKALEGKAAAADGGGGDAVFARSVSTTLKPPQPVATTTTPLVDSAATPSDPSIRPQYLSVDKPYLRPATPRAQGSFVA